MQDSILPLLTPDVVYRFQCGLCYESYHGEYVRHLAVRSGGDIGISLLINKRYNQEKIVLSAIIY